ncbi:hypothetical protein PMAYCL1PPCAC_01171, partial [Pristionchus mayeri]
YLQDTSDSFLNSTVASHRRGQSMDEHQAASNGLRISAADVHRIISSTGLSRPLDQSAPLLSSKIPSKTTAKYKCIVCHLRQRHAKMRVFTSHPTRRALWVNAVRSTPEGQKLLMAQLNETMMPLLCKSHFRPSDLDHFGSVPKLKHDAVPFF